MTKRTLSMVTAAALLSILPACKQKANEGEIRVVQVPVATGCVAPAATVADAPAATSVPLAKADPAKAAVQPVKTSSDKAKADGSALTVKRLVISTGVDRGTRRPSGEATSFTKGAFEKLYAFVEVENPGDEADIVVSFDPPSDKAERGNIELSVGRSPTWRTWGFSRAFDEAGTWTAIVRTRSGKELARTEFEVL